MNEAVQQPGDIARHVLTEILSITGVADHEKERLARKHLMDLPETTRAAVMQQLLDHVPGALPAVRARVWNVLQQITQGLPELAPVVTAEVILRDWRMNSAMSEVWEAQATREFATTSRAVAHELLARFDARVTSEHPPERRRYFDTVRETLVSLLDLADARTPREAHHPESIAQFHLDRLLTFVRHGTPKVAHSSHFPRSDELPGDATSRLLQLTLRTLDELNTAGPEDHDERVSCTYTLLDLAGHLAQLPTATRDDQQAFLRWTGGLHTRLGYRTEFDRSIEAVVRVALREDWLPTETLATLRRSAGISNFSGRFLDDVDLIGLTPPLSPGEVWADEVLALLDRSDEPRREAWRALLRHAAGATGARPSAKWEKTATVLLDRIGNDEVNLVLERVLPLVGKARTLKLTSGPYTVSDPNLTFDEFNAVVLRGLLWTLPLTRPQGAARLLGHVTQTSLRKVAGVGPRAPKIANAAVYALGRLEGEDALGQLTRLSTQVTFKTTLKEVQKALDAMAARLGVTRDDLAELGVPTYGLTDVGFRREVFGGSAAELHAQDGHVRLVWVGETGKPVKAPPTSVKQDFPDEVVELRGVVKDVEKMLAAQRDRLDALMLADRAWTFGAWRERYLDHPLVGVHARRLIWTVNGTPVIWSEGALRDVSGAEVEPQGDVKLWHPLFATVDEVVAWRARLETLGVRQPFKQAHREVYLLTDAERATRMYSNRFAAHVLRQHQFAALAALRGWDNTLRLMVDDSYPPATRALPRYGLRAEFWVEGIGDDYGVDTNESGTYLRLVTDQVRFYREGAAQNFAHAGGGGYGPGWGTQTPAEPVPLEEVPPLVLSEVLRDVDLFVGVASVGNDPTWQDGGPQGRFRDYWRSYSFGDLGATAQTRREVLARLLPRLKIAENCTLTDRFLVVRGEVRTYKIHLGSGNILMEPNDQYLCIVPARGASAGDGERVFLPFEGDATFSVILSKAFLLANDTAITDVTITRQIRPA